LLPWLQKDHFLARIRRASPRAVLHDEDGAMPRSEQSHRSAYFRDWYAKNAVEKRKSVAERKQAIQAWLSDYKATLSCHRCGFCHPACMEFHHISPANKAATIALMPTQGYSLERIKAEIAKCIVLCSNCHRILHWEQRQSAE
jgi:hypothetical protein